MQKIVQTDSQDLLQHSKHCVRRTYASDGFVWAEAGDYISEPRVSFTSSQLVYSNDPTLSDSGDRVKRDFSDWADTGIERGTFGLGTKLNVFEVEVLHSKGFGFRV
jgi:hypothetical protein